MKDKSLSHYNEVTAYITKDKSEIRELMHPSTHDCNNSSLAEARVPIGATTLLHLHHESEEVYYVIQGEGKMHLNTDSFPLTKGDSLCIKPGTPHRITNIGDCELRILCICSPAYQHEDTLLLEEGS